MSAKKYFCYTLLSIVTISFLYKKILKYIAFKKINNLFPRTEKFEFDLSINKASIPFSFTKNKKNKCILLIGGYRDTPYLWSVFKDKLIENDIDFYIPRTFSKGRTFFQYCSYKDWILTYYEMLSSLQYQYENVDIISLSAGSFIAIYLAQFKYECNINNIFLCAPYLCVKNDFFYNILYKLPFSSYYTLFLNFIVNIFFKFRLKFTSDGYKCVRDIYNEKNLDNDYYEFASCLANDNELMKMLTLKINKLQINGNMFILYSNNDYVIPNINKQITFLFDNNIYQDKIETILIPSNNNIKDKCGHVMFKESDEILNDINKNIFSRINSFYKKKF
jgi:esterase/lipase